MDNQVIMLECRIQELQAENARLKTEVKALKEELAKPLSDPQHYRKDSLYPNTKKEHH